VRPTRRTDPVRFTLIALVAIVGVGAWGVGSWFGERPQLGAAPDSKCVATDARAVPTDLPPPVLTHESLEPERQIEGVRVQMHDASGAPLADRRISIGIRGEFRRLVTERTDANGCCTLQNVESLLAAVTPAGGLTARLVLGLDEPFLPSTREQIHPGEPLPDTVLLGMPMTKPLTIRLVDAEGRRLRERAVAFVREHDENGLAAPDPMTCAEVELIEGEGTLPVVETCVDLDISIAGAPQGGGHCRWNTVRPTSIVEVAISTHDAVALARAIDPRGQPIRERMLRLSNGTILRTDADGRFRARVPPRAVVEGDGGSEHVEIWPLELAFALLADEPPHREIQWASWTLPEEFGLGRHDLSDLHFDDGVLAVAGRVVDLDGTAVAEARVQVSPSTAPPPRPISYELSTDRDGRFELRVREARDHLAIAIGKDGFVAANEEPLDAVPFGKQDLLLTLVPCPTLTGSLRLPSGFPPTAVRLVAVDARSGGERSARENRSQSWIRAFPIADDGTFRIERVAVPSIVVEFSATADLEPVRQIGLARFGREPEQAPRELQNIDLRDSLRSFTVRVREADGAPAPRAAIYRRGKGNDEVRIGSTDSEGCAVLGTSIPWLDLYASVRGRRSRWSDAVRGDTTLTLPPPLRVLVDLDDAQRFGLEPKWVHAFLEPIRPVTPADRAFIAADANGVLRAEVPCAGSWRLRLFYSPNGGGSLDLGDSAIELRDTTDAQTIRGIVDPESARAAAAKVGLTR
jgi:hypothetical protein